MEQLVNSILSTTWKWSGGLATCIYIWPPVDRKQANNVDMVKSTAYVLVKK